MKDIWVKGILVLFGVGVGLLGVELTSRALLRGEKGAEFESIDDIRSSIVSDDAPKPKSKSVDLRDIVAPHPNDRIIFDLRPNLDVTFQRVPVKTNSFGLRGKEISFVKPPNTYRIALLGDSFTFGWGVKQENIFAQVLEDNLNRLSRGNPKFEILNFGVPGYSTFQEVENFKEKGLCLDPDAVLVYFVQNDFGLPFFVRDFERPGGILSSVEFVRLAMKAVDPRVEEQKLATRGWDPNTALAALNKVTEERGIKTMFTINPRRSWKKELRKLWMIGRIKRIKVIPLRKDLLRIIRTRNIAEKDLTLPNDPHPSAIRHKILGDLLTPHFMDVIK